MPIIVQETRQNLWGTQSNSRMTVVRMGVGEGGFPDSDLPAFVKFHQKRLFRPDLDLGEAIERIHGVVDWYPLVPNVHGASADLRGTGKESAFVASMTRGRHQVDVFAITEAEADNLARLDLSHVIEFHEVVGEFDVLLEP